MTLHVNGAKPDSAVAVPQESTLAPPWPPDAAWVQEVVETLEEDYARESGKGIDETRNVLRRAFTLSDVRCPVIGQERVWRVVWDERLPMSLRMDVYGAARACSCPGVIGEPHPNHRGRTAVERKATGQCFWTGWPTYAHLGVHVDSWLALLRDEGVLGGHNAGYWNFHLGKDEPADALLEPCPHTGLVNVDVKAGSEIATLLQAFAEDLGEDAVAEHNVYSRALLNRPRIHREAVERFESNIGDEIRAEAKRLAKAEAVKQLARPLVGKLTRNYLRDYRKAIAAGALTDDEGDEDE